MTDRKTEDAVTREAARLYALDAGIDDAEAALLVFQASDHQVRDHYRRLAMRRMADG